MEDTALIIFVKNPQLGKVKTRLAATVGDKKALKIYHQLLEKTRDVSRSLSCSKVIYYSDFIEANDAFPSSLYRKSIQKGNTLGEKMQHAMEQELKAYQKVLIIGSDCYELTTKHLEKAISVLENHKAVIGPAKDGGYYLLGLRQMNNAIFDNKAWSTASVYNDTVSSFEKIGWRFYSLPPLSDVDHESDLGDLKKEME